MIRKLVSVASLMLALALRANGQEGTPSWKTVGAMSNVMRKGDLTTTLQLDTLKQSVYLFGLGPLDKLAGELLIIDGKIYKSFVNNHELNVQEVSSSGAPFFVFGYVKKWREVALPDSVITLAGLEVFLNHLGAYQPFFFRITGKIDQLDFHIVNLPRGTIVDSPAKTKLGQTTYSINNDTWDVIGFYSRQHQSIVTHHDTRLHAHAISTSKKYMGHVDGLTFTAKNIALLLSEE